MAFRSLGCLRSSVLRWAQKSHDFVVYLGCLHNEDGSDTSGGISMFTSTFKVEVELPKYMKSDVTWGHSGT